MDELSKEGKVVLGYFLKTSMKKHHNPSTIESMLLIVQMVGHTKGYNEGFLAAEDEKAITIRKQQAIIKQQNDEDDWDGTMWSPG